MTAIEHLLVCLAEEATEVAQAATKALRFGLDEHADGERTYEANGAKIYHEIHDLIAVYRMLANRTIALPVFAVDEDLIEAKIRKLIGMLNYSEAKGRLD